MIIYELECFWYDKAIFCLYPACRNIAAHKSKAKTYHKPKPYQRLSQIIHAQAMIPKCCDSETPSAFTSDTIGQQTIPWDEHSRTWWSISGTLDSTQVMDILRFSYKLSSLVWHCNDSGNLGIIRISTMTGYLGRNSEIGNALPTNKIRDCFQPVSLSQTI